ncbi:glycosyltransferase family 2 protein [Pseudopedobacter beijingensis]
MKSISVVIPNYNGKHLFERYFEHNFNIIKSLKTDTEIIVVDDASTDSSVEYLEQNYRDKIQIIKKEQNSGFSNSCNLGINASKNDLVFLLNTDVKLNEGYFDNLFKYFEKEDTFGVMGRIIGMDDNNIQESARLPKVSGKKIKPSNFFYIENPTSFTPTFYLSGAIALIDSKKLKELNGFNELFNPFYCEDQELSIRAWRMGWKCYYEHSAICRHEVSGSTKFHSDKWAVKKLYFRNRYYVHYLHLSGSDLLLWHLQVAIVDVMLTIVTLQFYKIPAYLTLFFNRKKLKRKKKAFNRQMSKRDTNHDLLEIINQLEASLDGRNIIKI